MASSRLACSGRLRRAGRDMRGRRRGSRHRLRPACRIRASFRVAAMMRGSGVKLASRRREGGRRDPAAPARRFAALRQKRRTRAAPGPGPSARVPIGRTAADGDRQHQRRDTTGPFSTALPAREAGVAATIAAQRPTTGFKNLNFLLTPAATIVRPGPLSIPRSSPMVSRAPTHALCRLVVDRRPAAAGGDQRRHARGHRAVARREPAGGRPASGSIPSISSIATSCT